MTEKNLKSMNRAELIEEIQALMRENDELGERVERLQAQLKESKARAAGREIAIANAGSIAEAALALNGVFEQAQAAADEYLRNIARMKDEQEKACAAMLEETRLKCREMEIGTQRRCDELFRTAQAEASQKWSTLARQLETAVHEYVSDSTKD